MLESSNGGILGKHTDRTHGHTVSTITPQVLDIDVGCAALRQSSTLLLLDGMLLLGLGAEAVVSNIDLSVQDGQTINIVGIKSISVLWQGL